jgi:ABC-type multidrug transport system fused ATPase/permease subunit
MLKILKRFYGFVLKKRFVSLVFLVVIIIAPLSESILPYFYKLFVDAIPSLDYRKLFNLLLLYTIVYFASRILSTLAFLLGDILTFDAGIKARTDVFKHIHDLDFAYHTNKSSGSLISAIKRGDNAFWELHHSIHYRIVAVVINFAVMMYFFAQLDWLVFIFAAVSFLATLVVSKLFITMNIKTRNVFNKEEDKISAVIVDNMVNFETVKLFAKEAWEESRLKKEFVSWKKALWDFSLTYRFLDIAMGALIVGSIFGMLFVSMKMTLSGRFSIGDFVLVVGFSGAFYSRLFDLIWGLRQIAKNYSDIERYFGILDIGISVKDPAKATTLDRVRGEVKFDNVSFSYGESERNAVRNIDIKIRPGQSIALVGRSGAGKTTLVKLLMRFFDVNKGKISLDGVDLRKFKKATIRSYIGVVPQEPVLFNNTIGYNIAYGIAGADKKQIIAASKMANIHDFIASLPKGYKTHVGERGIKLSGGQKQRVAIARMILSDPQIVIFDEATSQLDSESEKLIQDAFWRAVKNKTTIIIAHRLSTVKRADKIVVMDKGRIVEAGSHNELINKKDGIYQRLWKLQKID